MIKSVVVTSRISAVLSDRLDQLAADTERSRAWLIAKAIESYVEKELAMIAFIEEGDADFREGRTVSQAEMKAWVESLGRPASAAA